LFIMIVNITEIPSVFVLIFQSAFGLSEVAGGALGAAMMNGINVVYFQMRLVWEVLLMRRQPLMSVIQLNKD
jgi:Na+/alanine symporter